MLLAKKLEGSIQRLELYPRLTNSQLAEDIVNVLIELKVQRKTIEILNKKLLKLKLKAGKNNNEF